MSYVVNPISPTHPVSKYCPRKIRDQSEFIEQIARCTRISIHREAPLEAHSVRGGWEESGNWELNKKVKGLQ